MQEPPEHHRYQWRVWVKKTERAEPYESAHPEQPPGQGKSQHARSHLSKAVSNWLDSVKFRLGWWLKNVGGWERCDIEEFLDSDVNHAVYLEKHEEKKKERKSLTAEITKRKFEQARQNFRALKGLSGYYGSETYYEDFVHFRRVAVWREGLAWLTWYTSLGVHPLPGSDDCKRG